MDARGSISGTGFDAALRALDELETDVTSTRETSAPPVASPAIGAIAIDFDPLSDDVLPAPAVASMPIAIVAEPVDLIAMELEAAMHRQPAGDVTREPVPVVAGDSVRPGPAAPSREAEPVASVTPAPAKASILPRLAIGLGLFSSIISAVGLVVVSRTVVGASLVVADARERQVEMKKVGALLHELEQMRARQAQLLQRQEAAAASPLLTVKDLDQRFAGLDRSMAGRDQSKSMFDMVHAGQNQLSEIMGSIGAKVTRIEEKLDSRH